MQWDTGVTVTAGTQNQTQSLNISLATLDYRIDRYRILPYIHPCFLSLLRSCSHAHLLSIFVIHPLSLYSSCTRVFQIFDNFSFVKTFAQVTSVSALTLSNAELISLVVDSANVQMNLFHVEQFSWAYGSNKYTYVTFLSLLSLISSLSYPFTIFFSSSFFFAGKLQQASLQEESHTW